RWPRDWSSDVCSSDLSRADLVSGGDALVALGNVDSTDGLKVTVGGDDQTSAFSRGSDGRIEGVVTGLKLGANRLVADAPGRSARSEERRVGKECGSGR